MNPDKTNVKRAAHMLKALGNEHRLQIMLLLLNGEKNVSEINKNIRVSQPSLSQHLSKLRREGLLAARRDQRQIYYSISNLHIPRLMTVADEMAQQAALVKKAKTA